MIFSIGNHIEQIKNGEKVQTRRPTARYRVGGIYSIQPCRTCKGIPEGKIKIFKRHIECNHFKIGEVDAKEEGGYTPDEFENLYKSMYPNWEIRYAYVFRFLSNNSCD